MNKVKTYILREVKIEMVTMQLCVAYCLYWGYTFPLGLLMGKRAALRPLMPSAAAFTAPCCAPLRSAPCSGRISETRAQLPTLSESAMKHRFAPHQCGNGTVEGSTRSADMVPDAE